MRSITLRTPLRLLAALAVLRGAAGLAGCSSIDPVAPANPPITDPTELYMRLKLDNSAITMSTAAGYNTVQLTATPHDAQGNPMPDLPAPTFEVPVSDTAKIRVTANGLVTAVGTASQVSVIATLTVGPVTHADTARIQVTNLTSPPALDTLSIDPVPPDSARRGVPAGWTATLLQDILWGLGLISTEPFPPLRVLPRTVDASGTTISGLTFEYTSLDPTIATINRHGDGRVNMILSRAGSVRMVARTLAYGIARADTATFTVTPPVSMEFEVGGDGGTFRDRLFGTSTNEVRIAPYGVVGWMTNRDLDGGAAPGDSVDVVFDGPTPMVPPSAEICDALVNILGLTEPCGVGNFAVHPYSSSNDVNGIFLLNTLKLRQFPTPGVYPFHSTLTGGTGRIIVTTDLE